MNGPITPPLSRRGLVLAASSGALALAWPLPSPAQPAVVRKRPKSPPVWTGFGLNGSAGQARFDLTREHVRRVKNGMALTNSEAFDWLREPMKKLLREQTPPNVQFKDSVEFGQDMLVGFAHDYEVTVGARVEKDGDNANTLFIFMSGVGLILSYDPSSSWRVVSSFPFLLRFERLEKDLSNVPAKAAALMGEAYLAYAKAFTHFLGRFNKWDQGFSSNYFARLTRAAVHREALPKLVELKLDKHLNAEMIGFSASASLCDQLNIPVLPFQDNDALSKRYAVKFNNDLRAQDVMEIPDADLKFELILRDIEKKVIPSKQKGITIIRRQVVLNFRVLDAFSPNPEKPILQTIAAADYDEDKIPYGSTVDDTPERDLVFFDRLITRTLTFLLSGLATKNAELLAQAGVKLDTLAPALPRFLDLCAKTRSA
jgi:hypothetical protein